MVAGDVAIDGRAVCGAAKGAARAATIAPADAAAAAEEDKEGANENEEEEEEEDDTGTAIGRVVMVVNVRFEWPRRCPVAGHVEWAHRWAYNSSYTCLARAIWDCSTGHNNGGCCGGREREGRGERERKRKRERGTEREKKRKRGRKREREEG